jgi:hypothetical protein
MIKLTLVVVACGLLCFMGTALALPHYDWISPGGVATVHYNTWSYLTPAYYYTGFTPVAYDPWWGFTPVAYNSFDPWWAVNVYGPVRATYYWDGWGWG